MQQKRVSRVTARSEQRAVGGQSCQRQQRSFGSAPRSGCDQPRMPKNKGV